MKLFGNYTALITPFLSQNKIDYDALDNILNLQINEKTDGIVLFGSTGEGHTLTLNEKIKILKFVKEKVHSNISIIVSILSYSTKDCKKEISVFSKYNPDAFLISVPPYIKPTQAGILKHFLTLASNSAVPIILYNIPSRTSANIEFETMKKLSLHPNIIGVKEASTCFSDIVKESNLISSSFQILCGNDNFILPMLSIGACGVVSVIGNAMPSFVHTLFEMYSFDPQLVENLYRKYEPLINAMSIETNPIPIKFYMSLLLKVKPIYRMPLCQPGPKHKKQIREIFNMITQK